MLSVLIAAIRPSITFLLLLIFGFLTLILYIREEKSRFLLILVFTSFVILLGCEIIYFDDAYGGELERINTVFKFHYMAHAFLYLAAPVFFHETYSLLKRRGIKIFLLVAFIFLFAISAIYPVLGTAIRKFNKFHKNNSFDLSLDGTLFLQKYFREEYEAIQWIKEKTDVDDVILEVSDKPFGYYSRFATFSGRRCVLGWGNHELLWRPSEVPVIMMRREDIKKIYSQTDKRRILNLIKKYNIKWIITGFLEFRHFEKETLSGFDKVFEKAYSNRIVSIYRVE
jgi:uncharacterized membrane protein